jgi:hypothetical protein
VNFAYRLIDPKNAPFVEGRSNHIASGNDWGLVLSGFGLWFLFFAIFAASLLGLIDTLIRGDELRARIPITLVFGAGMAFFTYLIIPSVRSILADRQLARHGQLLPGKLTAVQRIKDNVRVSYEFLAPDGRILTGITGAPYYPSAYSAPGGDLVILYLNDRLHKAL